MSTGVNYSTFFESTSVTATTADAGADVLYTVPNNHDAEITFLIVTNGGATQNVSIQVYHGDDLAYHHIVREESVAGNSHVDVVHGGASLFLHAGDKICVYKGGGTVDVSVSGKKYYNPTRG